MRCKGKVSSWKDDKGFGFITPNEGGKQVFVHIKSFSNRQRRPVTNEIVTYELKINERGRAQAESVLFSGEQIPSVGRPGENNTSLVLTALLIVFVAGLVFSGELPIAVLGLYLIASSIAFGFYAFDKSAARNDEWRIQESTLHLLALIGGWPGALAAQRLLRHKSKKQSFQIVFWVTVILNCGVLGWLFTPSGAGALHTIFDVVT